MKCAIFILGLSALSASIFALDIEILLYPEEPSEKMDLEGHLTQNTISHCIISKGFQITLHFFSGSKFCNASDKSRFILGNI